MCHDTFRPAWWLPGPHLQTLFPQLFRKRQPPALQRERLELDDGDFIDLDWTPINSGPLVVLLHGLEGSVHSHYAAGLMRSLHSAGIQSVLMHFRNCSEEPNRLPRSYHSGETGDLRTLLRTLNVRYPERKLYAVGVSLGGNVLLKYLGEKPTQTLLGKAVAVSVPFELNDAARRLNTGFSRLYQAYLLRKLRRSTRRKAERVKLPLDIDKLHRLRTFHAFDDTITAVLHGFNGVDDYYKQSSSRQYLKNIQTSTLILQARDDPFLPTSALPGDCELGPGVSLELHEHGGHVGFIAGRYPLRPVYWLDQRIVTALKGKNPTSF